MESIFARYRNFCILVGVLFAQVLGLAIQVRRTSGDESTRLIRVWAVGAVTPFEKGIVWMQSGTGNMWRNYVYLRGVRQENRDLKLEIEHMRLERVRLKEDAEQARRLQALLAFKEQYISKTTAAQVIGSSGSEQSRAVYIDKGSNDGIKPDMAVITADGIVGKVLRAFGSTSQVLLINDQSSGVGAILENSRLQGIVKGMASGEVLLDKVMADDTVAAGETLRTSGGDQVFPKGLPIGVVSKVSRTTEPFLSIRVKPAANLSKLEEVLVITEREERIPTVTQTAPERAADILARRLPSVPDKPAEQTAPADAAKPPVTKPKPVPNNATVPPSGATTNTTVNGAHLIDGQPVQKKAVVPVSAGEPKPKPAEPQPEPPASQDNPN